MYMEIKDNKKVIFKSDDEKDIIKNLMFYTYEVAIKKSKCYSIKYQYNYSDKQTITIKEKFDNLNNRTITLYNIPTKTSYLDIDTLVR